MSQSSRLGLLRYAPWLVPLCGLLTGAALAQTHSILIQEGDVMPATGVVIGVKSVLVNDVGEWVAEAIVEAASGDRRIIWIDAQGIRYDSLQGLNGLPPNATLASIVNPHLSPEGRFSGGAFLDGVPNVERNGILLDDQLALLAGDPVIAAGLPTAASFRPWFSFARANDRDQLLVGANYSESPTQQWRPIVLRYDLLGSTIIQPGEVIAGATQPLSTGFTSIAGSGRAGFNNQGDSIFVAEKPSDELSLGAVVLNGEVLLHDGTPSPVPGETWAGIYTATVALNERGDYMIAAYISSAVPTARVLFRNDELVARTGMSYPELQPHTLSRLDASDRGFADTGAVLWHGESTSGDPLHDEFLFINDKVLVEEQVTMFGGQRVTGLQRSDLYHIWFDRAISPNGRYVVCALHLDGLSSAVLIDTQQGLGYCDPATLNSSGAAATLDVYGSDEASAELIFLSARQLPQRTFGLFLCSQDQGLFMPASSQGSICLAGSIGRFQHQLQSSGDAGLFAIEVDTTALPVTPNQAILAGQTWNFQAWFRDTNPSPTSNTTSAVSVTFQ